MRRTRLIDNWKMVLKRAWSIRLAAVAGVLSGAEAMLNAIADKMPDLPAGGSPSGGWLPVLAAVCGFGALVARIVDQQNITPKEDSNEQ